MLTGNPTPARLIAASLAIVSIACAEEDASAPRAAEEPRVDEWVSAENGWRCVSRRGDLPADQHMEPVVIRDRPPLFIDAHEDCTTFAMAVDGDADRLINVFSCWSDGTLVVHANGERLAGGPRVLREESDTLCEREITWIFYEPSNGEGSIARARLPGFAYGSDVEVEAYASDDAALQPILAMARTLRTVPPELRDPPE